MSHLADPMRSDNVRAEPLAELHRADLKAACATDTQIWAIYPRNFGPDGFDAEFDGFLANDWASFALFDGDRLVGMSSFINAQPDASTVEIGATYYHPDMRGTGFNRTVKDMMIRRARDCGYAYVQFKVDARNERSCAAVMKLGARRLRVDEKDRTTWTGHVRDTVVFQLDTADWAG